MVLLGSTDRYLPVAQTRNVQVALAAVYLVWFVLKRTWLDRDEFEEKFPTLVER